MPAGRRHACRHACKPQACRGHAAGRGRAGPVPRGWAVKGSLRELQALEQTFPFRQHLSREVELVFLHLSASRVDAARRKDALTGKESMVPYPSESLGKRERTSISEFEYLFPLFPFIFSCLMFPRAEKGGAPKWRTTLVNIFFPACLSRGPPSMLARGRVFLLFQH